MGEIILCAVLVSGPPSLRSLQGPVRCLPHPWICRACHCEKGEHRVQTQLPLQLLSGAPNKALRIWWTWRQRRRRHQLPKQPPFIAPQVFCLGESVMMQTVSTQHIPHPCCNLEQNQEHVSWLVGQALQEQEPNNKAWEMDQLFTRMMNMRSWTS